MTYETTLRTRIPEEWMDELQKMARQEGLKVSDISRRAIRMMLGRKAALPRSRGAK